MVTLYRKFRTPHVWFANLGKLFMGNYLIRAVCTALSESGKPLLKALQFVHSEATERSLLIAREMERDTAKASSAVQYFYSCLLNMFLSRYTARICIISCWSVFRPVCTLTMKNFHDCPMVHLGHFLIWFSSRSWGLLFLLVLEGCLFLRMHKCSHEECLRRTDEQVQMVLRKYAFREIRLGGEVLCWRCVTAGTVLKAKQGQIAAQLTRGTREIQDGLSWILSFVFLSTLRNALLKIHVLWLTWFLADAASIIFKDTRE